MPPPGYREAVKRALPGTSQDIVKKSGVMPSTVVRWLRIMRDAGECHIGSWKRTIGTGGALKAVYVRGPGADAPMPKRLGDAEYSERYRIKCMNDPEKRRLRLTQRSNYYWSKKAATQGDPLINALFGKGRVAEKGNL